MKLYLEQRSRKSLTEVARENGVGAETLRNWVKAYEKAHPVEEEPRSHSAQRCLTVRDRSGGPIVFVVQEDQGCGDDGAEAPGAAAVAA